MVRKPVSAAKKKKNLADKLAGDKVRSRGYCEMGGRDKVKCNGSLQWAHIVGRSNHRLRWEAWNALCLCAGHHMYYTYHPFEWNEIIRDKFPANYKLIKQHHTEIWDKNIDKVIERLRNE